MLFRSGPFGGRKLFLTFCKSALASLVMGVVIYYGRTLLSTGTFTLQAAQLGALAILGAFIYFLFAYLLKIEELQSGLAILRNKVNKA